MPPRKKGRRSHFDRRKNSERHTSHVISVQHDSTNSTVTLLPSSTAVQQSVSLPENWQLVHCDEGQSQYCRLEVQDRECKVTLSLFVDPIHSWQVYVNGRRVPSTCQLLQDFHVDALASDSAMVMTLINRLDSAFVCPGNSDEKFVDDCKKRGGEIKTNRGNGETVAYIDRAPIIDANGKYCDCTIRRVDCDILCDPVGLYPIRCKHCDAFRSTLRSSLSRRKHSEDRTLSTSHTNYGNLSSDEKDKRMRSLHKSLVSEKQRVSQMKRKVKAMIENESVLLQSDDAADMASVAADIAPLLEKSFPANSPQRIFWDQQALYNQLSDKRQMRWHPMVMRFALNLKYLSTSAYRAVHQSGLLHLPSQRTLSDYTHWSEPHSGVQLEFIEELCRQLQDVKTKHCTISMDEMKIKSGLVFNKHSGTLVGFVDLGNVNREFELLMCQGMEQPDTPEGKKILQ